MVQNQEQASRNHEIFAGMEDVLASRLTIDQVIATYLFDFKNKQYYDKDDDLQQRHQAHLNSLKAALAKYDDEKKLWAYFELLKTKHTAVDKEKYYVAAFYRDVLNNLEENLFPYKTSGEYLVLESKLKESGKTKNEIAFFFERRMLANLENREYHSQTISCNKFYKCFRTSTLRYLKEVIASQQDIEAFSEMMHNGNYS